MEWTLPLSNPVMVFLIVMLITLLLPLLLHRVKIPGLVGLMLAGAILGPNGINLLERGQGVTLFGTVGLLYIMFWAGLEIDLLEFMKKRYRSLVFGFFTFAIPLASGILVGKFILGYSLMASILLASMFSTHTLISYPIINRLGLARIEAVTITIGGTIITDTLALLVLTLVASAARGELEWRFGLQLLLGVLSFVLIVWRGLPLVARWFFRYVESEGGAQYVFVLVGVLFSAALAEIVGLEPIIGAFLAGLAFNRLIPHTSPLMSRIEFVGNYLFIPFFLISVGMLIDLSYVFSGTAVLYLSLLLTVLALVTKWLAAFFTQITFGYSVRERNIIFGLSSSHAAATIAIILIGYDVGLLNEDVLNATILLILVTCLTSSFVTDRAGRRLVLEEGEAPSAPVHTGQRILVPISNPATLPQLIDLAVLLKEPGSPEPIYPLQVILDDAEARERIAGSRRHLEQAARYASEAGVVLQPIHRLDVNPAGGIVRTTTEMMATLVVIGWSGKLTAKERLFGTLLDNVLEMSREMLLVVRLNHPVKALRRLSTVVPPNSHMEPGFPDWVQAIRLLGGRLPERLRLAGDQEAMTAAVELLSRDRRVGAIEQEAFDDWEQPERLLELARPGDLLLWVSARPGSLSHQPFFDHLPQMLAYFGEGQSFGILYPAQPEGDRAGSLLD